jgi:hypothetical protein
MIEVYLVQIRQKELLAEAERQRMVAIARQSKSNGISTGARFMAYLGVLLNRWGSQLEERFAVEAIPEQVRSVKRGLKV